MPCNNTMAPQKIRHGADPAPQLGFCEAPGAPKGPTELGTAGAELSDD